MLQPRLPAARTAWLTLVGTGAFLLLWTVAAQSGLTSRNFLPTPWDVVVRFAQLVVEPFAASRCFSTCCPASSVLPPASVWRWWWACRSAC